MPEKKTRVNYSKGLFRRPTSVTVNGVNYGPRGAPLGCLLFPAVSGGCLTILYWITIGWFIWLVKKIFEIGTPVFNTVSLKIQDKFTSRGHNVGITLANLITLGILIFIVSTCCMVMYLITNTQKPTEAENQTSLPVYELTSTSTEKPMPTKEITQTVASVFPDCIMDKSDYQIGTVIEIVDGDTIRVKIDGVEYPLRYIGIDTPEANDPFGEESFNANKDLVLGKEVTLFKDMSEVDRYSRLLRYVFVDSIFVNQELVAKGYATAYDYYPDTSCSKEISSAQMEGKSMMLGIWGLPTIAPTVGEQLEATPTLLSGGCPQGCLEEKSGCNIKGNINSEGVKIYHTTSSPNYTATKIDPGKGERWFCTTDEAIANGWRAPRN